MYSTLPKHFPMSAKCQSGYYFLLFAKQILSKENAVSLHMQKILHFMERVPAQVFDELMNGYCGRNICIFNLNLLTSCRSDLHYCTILLKDILYDTQSISLSG